MKKNLFFIYVFIVLFSVWGFSSETVDRPLMKHSGYLLENRIIEDATFIDLNFQQFPLLPEYFIPHDNAVFVALTGSDDIGDGSLENPFRTIYKALSIASSGFTIIVRQGQYQECNGWIYDHRALVISKDNISLIAYPEEEVEVIPYSSATHTGIEISGNNTIIRGINLAGFSTGILFDGILNPDINNTVIANLDISLIDSEWSTGITLQVPSQINGLLVYDVSIINAGLIGIHCGPGNANHWRIENTRIIMNAQGSGSGADAFAVENGDNILLVNSEFTGATADGIDTKATRVVVFNCIVHNVGRNGIKFWYGGDIINSIILHTGADASISAGGERIRLLHSIIGYHNYNGDLSYNMVFGYGIQYPITVEIINCIVFNSSGGSYFSESTDLTISHSLFFNMQNGIILEHGSNFVYTSQGAGGLAQYGQGNLVQDPGLDDNFYPLPESILINNGIALPFDYPEIDIQGKPRIIDSFPDIGPWETNYNMSTALPVYRFFNTVRGGHLYTISDIERDFIIEYLSEWNYEGIKFRVLIYHIPGTAPSYRFFNTNTGIHFYTINEYERDTVMELPWYNYEGISFYVYSHEAPGTIPVFRFFNNVQGGHLYTISEHERDTVLQLSEWDYEGVPFFVIPHIKD